MFKLLTKLISSNNYWYSKGFFYRPFCYNDSSPKSSRPYIKFFGPRIYTIYFTRKCYHFIFTSIAGLFFQGNPATIFFRVIVKIINSINLRLFFSKFFYMSLVRFVHIVFELIKRVPRTFNSDLSIPNIRYVRRVIATSAYRLINIIKSFMGKSMYRFSTLFLKMSATFCMSISQIYSSNKSYLATVANTFPLNLFISSARFFKNQQMSKPLPNNIYSVFMHIKAKIRLMTQLLQVKSLNGFWLQ